MNHRSHHSYYLAYLVVLILTSAEGSVATQQFEKQPVYTEVNPGQETRLTCKIYDKKGECSWQKDGKPVGIYLGKYDWSGNPDVGDCSLNISNAALEYDDGEWECQVTASDFAAQDALTSRPVKLIVRVAPKAPQIMFNGSYISTGRNLTTPNGQRTSVTCTSKSGNPAAIIKWFVGDEEIIGVNQTNKTEDAYSKRWSAISILDYTFHRGHNGQRLRCVAVHEAYPTKQRHTTVLMDIQYSPSVKIDGGQNNDLEEHKDHLQLKCDVDSNPSATVVWRKAGRPEIFSFESTVELNPVLRRHTGSYSCEAKNFLGTSQPASVDVDVKYEPKILRVGPERVVSAAVNNRSTLICQAEGNPQPSYEWLQRSITEPNMVYIRGSESMLMIQNVTYEHQGDYICKASNVIKGVERVVESDPIELSVLGAPQFLPNLETGATALNSVTEVEEGEDGILSVTFCSNPSPKKAIWQWGSVKLETGYDMERFTAHKIMPLDRSHCFEAQFEIGKAGASDSRHYFLQVDNNRGTAKHSAQLVVRDPVSMATVIIVILACLILLVILVLVIVYAFRSEKWCFSRRNGFKPADLDSEKSEVSHGIGGMNHGHTNGKPFNSMGHSEFHLSGNSHGGVLYGRKNPEPLFTPDLQLMKPRVDRKSGFNRKGNGGKIIIHKEINYADLQLPKTSNNGSMKKSNRGGYQGSGIRPSIIHHHPAPLPRNIPPINPKPKVSEVSSSSRSCNNNNNNDKDNSNNDGRVDYAQIKFGPKSSGRMSPSNLLVGAPTIAGSTNSTAKTTGGSISPMTTTCSSGLPTTALSAAPDTSESRELAQI